MQVPSVFESIALQRFRFERHIVFFYKSDFEENFAFGKLSFGAFFFVKTPKLAVLCFLLQKKPEKKTGMANSFWIRKNYTSVSDKQLFHNSSVFFFTTCQMLNQHFYNASGFQVELCIYKIKFCCKTRFWILFLQNYTVKTSKMEV